MCKYNVPQKTKLCISHSFKFDYLKNSYYKCYKLGFNRLHECTKYNRFKYQRLFTCKTEQHSPEQIVADQQRLDGIGLGRQQHMCRAVERSRRVRLQRLVEPLQSFHLTDGHRAGHTIDDRRVLQDLRHRVRISGRRVHQHEFTAIVSQHSDLGALGRQIGEELVLDETRRGEQHTLDHREVNVAHNGLQYGLVEALHALVVLAGEAVALARNGHLDFASHQRHAGLDQAHVRQAVLHQDGGQVKRLGRIAGERDALEGQRVPFRLAYGQCGVDLHVDRVVGAHLDVCILLGVATADAQNAGVGVDVRRLDGQRQHEAYALVAGRARVRFGEHLAHGRRAYRVADGDQIVQVPDVLGVLGGEFDVAAACLVSATRGGNMWLV